jgi:uncharacterized protein (TIGR02118 family)
MLSVTFCVRRRPDISAAEFHRYWSEEHGGLVASHAGALRFDRYVQHHTVASPVGDAMARARGTIASFDGVAQVFFADVTALSAAGTTPEGRAAAKELIADEVRFIDLSASSIFVTEEIETWAR